MSGRINAHFVFLYLLPMWTGVQETRRKNIEKESADIGATIHDMELAQRERDSLIARLQNDLKQRDTQLATLTKAAIERELRYKEVDRQRLEQLSKINALSRDVTKTTEQMARLELALKKAETQSNELEAERDRLSDKLTEYKSQELKWSVHSAGSVAEQDALIHSLEVERDSERVRNSVLRKELAARYEKMLTLERENVLWAQKIKDNEQVTLPLFVSKEVFFWPPARLTDRVACSLLQAMAASRDVVAKWEQIIRQRELKSEQMARTIRDAEQALNEMEMARDESDRDAVAAKRMLEEWKVDSARERDTAKRAREHIEKERDRLRIEFEERSSSAQKKLIIAEQESRDQLNKVTAVEKERRALMDRLTRLERDYKTLEDKWRSVESGARDHDEIVKRMTADSGREQSLLKQRLRDIETEFKAATAEQTKVAAATLNAVEAERDAALRRIDEMTDERRTVDQKWAEAIRAANEKDERIKRLTATIDKTEAALIAAERDRKAADERLAKDRTLREQKWAEVDRARVVHEEELQESVQRLQLQVADADRTLQEWKKTEQEKLNAATTRASMAQTQVETLTRQLEQAHVNLANEKRAAMAANKEHMARATALWKERITAIEAQIRTRLDATLTSLQSGVDTLDERVAGLEADLRRANHMLTEQADSSAKHLATRNAAVIELKDRCTELEAAENELQTRLKNTTDELTVAVQRAKVASAQEMEIARLKAELVDAADRHTQLTTALSGHEHAVAQSQAAVVAAAELEAQRKADIKVVAVYEQKLRNATSDVATAQDRLQALERTLKHRYVWCFLPCVPLQSCY